MQTQSEFARLRQLAGLSIEETAHCLAVSVRSVYRYESGEAAPPGPARQMLIWLAADRTEHSQPEFRFIDLFAGIGGMRRPFEEIGGECVFTCEWDSKCMETYAANFSTGHQLGEDIREYSEHPERVPDHDVLLAGFPCQPFSIAGVSKKNALGRPHGFLCDTQGTLFFDLAQIIEHHRPKVFLLENVRNLERHDEGRTFHTIMNVLRNELGYHVHYRTLNARRWLPQNRDRIFIVGFREPSAFSFDTLPVPSEGPKLGSILQGPHEVDPKYTLTAHLWGYLRDYKEKHAAKGNGFGYGLFGPDDVARTLSARYFKDGSEILVRQGGRRRPRRLTPRECARLMGFDGPRRPEFKITVSDTQAYKQFGNAVAVPVVEAVAQHMKPHIFAAIEEERQPAKKRAHG